MNFFSEVKVAGRDIAVNRDFELDVTFQNVTFVVKRLSSFFIGILYFYGMVIAYTIEGVGVPNMRLKP